MYRFSKLLPPLYPGFCKGCQTPSQTVKKNKRTSECQDSFALLKCKLTSAPVLTFLDYDQIFILDADASGNGMGAVQSQLDPNGSKQMVAYASRTLSKPERRCYVICKEILAVVYFINHFHPYCIFREKNPTFALTMAALPNFN